MTSRDNRREPVQIRSDSFAEGIEAELARRLALSPEAWEPVGPLSDVTAEARARLAALRRAESRRG